MYYRLEDIFNYLEDRIRRSASLFSASGFCGEPADATLASEEKMFAVGMVACDGEGRLNEKSILLQGGRVASAYSEWIADAFSQLIHNYAFSQVLQQPQEWDANQATITSILFKLVSSCQCLIHSVHKQLKSLGYDDSNL